MSWSVSAVGKPTAVAAKCQEELTRFKCIDPEEGVKLAAASTIAAALAAQNPQSAVKVMASGHQSGTGETATNTLNISVEPLYGFVE